MDERGSRESQIAIHRDGCEAVGVEGDTKLREEGEDDAIMTTWSYGVTTVPSRVSTLLPKTLKSLAEAGFTSPRLFIDGQCDSKLLSDLHSPRITQRDSQVGAFGSWLLAAWELYIREPQAQMYAIFQDDLVMCRGVKEYLEKIEYPKKSYLNLFTFADNESFVWGQPQEWCKSDQLGKGGLALVFDHEAITTLLQQSHMVHKPQLPKGYKNLDGAVQHALVAQAGFTEYVHNPSLVQHTGEVGTLDNPKHPLAKTFPGEQFDARSLLS